MASLLFVGYQIKQTRDIAISEAFQARAESTASYTAEISANDRAISAMTKARLSQGEKITPEEFTSLTLYMSGGLYLWENSYYQSTQGYVPTDHWVRTRASMKNIINPDPMLSIVKQQAEFMRPGFRRELEAVIAEIEREGAAQ